MSAWQACPTGALTNKAINNIPIQPRATLDAVDTVCPYCGVGCALTYYVDRERGASHSPRSRPTRQSRPAVCEGPLRLGLRGLTAAAHQALIRIAESYPKGPLSSDVKADGGEGRSDKVAATRRLGALRRGDAALREASWEEALDLVARRLDKIRPRAVRRHRRLWVGQVLQRGGLPLPEADPHRLPHQQRRLLHPAVPRVQCRGAVRGRRLWRGLDHLRRHRERRRRDHHRQQCDRQPPVASSFFKQARRRGTRSSTSTCRPAPSPSTPTSSANSNPAPMWRSTAGSCTR